MVFKLIRNHITATTKFENDVKTYGIQTKMRNPIQIYSFENDVKTYGIQTVLQYHGRSQ